MTLLEVGEIKYNHLSSFKIINTKDTFAFDFLCGFPQAERLTQIDYLLDLMDEVKKELT